MNGQGGRFKACQELRMLFTEYTGDDPTGFVVSLNLHRRHLDESQRSMVAQRLETMKQGRPGKDANLHVSREQAAALLNVSTRSVAAAAKVREHGTPELVAAVERGAVKVSDAAAIAEKSHDEQQEALEAVLAGEAKTVKAASRARPGGTACHQPLGLGDRAWTRPQAPPPYEVTAMPGRPGHARLRAGAAPDPRVSLDGGRCHRRLPAAGACQ